MLRTIFASLAILVALAGSVHAGLLFNEDDQPHGITFERGNGRVKTSVQPGKAVLFECSKACTITVEQSGHRIELRGDEQDVVIKAGRLERRGQR